MINHKWSSCYFSNCGCLLIFFSISRLVSKATQALHQQAARALVNLQEGLGHNPHSHLALPHQGLGQPAPQPLVKALPQPLVHPPRLPLARQALGVQLQPLAAQLLPLAKAAHLHLGRHLPLAHPLLPLVVAALAPHKALQPLVPPLQTPLEVSLLTEDTEDGMATTSGEADPVTAKQIHLSICS